MAPSRDTNPSAYQEMFVHELRTRRETVRLSRNKLAEALGCTPQWIAKVEAFEKPPSEGLADDLDTYFSGNGVFRRMLDKHVEARKRGLIPNAVLPLVAAEKEANRISMYEPLLITGLLQTEDYARMALRSEQRPDKAEELVAVRMERQSIFTKPSPPWLFILLREAVIRDLDPEVKKGQCKHLLDVVEQRDVSIQLIPASARVFQGSGFQLLSFTEGRDMAYVDGACGNGQMLTDPREVDALTLCFNVIRSTAMPVVDSLNLIRKIMEDR
jgi:transcriptional regulator with XRE-family HTH domain